MLTRIGGESNTSGADAEPHLGKNAIWDSRVNLRVGTFLPKTQKAERQGRKAELSDVVLAFLLFFPLRLCEKHPLPVYITPDA